MYFDFAQYKQKGFIPVVILVGILVILATAGGAYYFFKVKTPVQKPCTMDAEICPGGDSVGRTGPNCEFSPCPSPKQTNTSDETANWKKYENSAWEIIFKYPNDWVQENIDSSRLRFNWESEPIMSIKYWPNPKKLNPLDFLKDLDKEIENKEAQITGSFMQSPKIYSPNLQLIALSNDMEAYFQDQVNCEPYICEEYVFSHKDKDKIYLINIFSHSNLPANFNQTINKIFSTFKFTQ